MQNLTIVIPCLNEVDTIGKVINDINLYYPKLPIIVVDNGSDDGSQLIVSKTNALLIEEPRKGKTNAVRAALKHITTEYVLLIDADDEYKAIYVSKLLDVLQPNSMIIGVRPTHMMMLSSLIANFVIQTSLFIRYHKVISDCLTGMRIIPTKLLELVNSTHFELETELNKLCLEHDYKIIPVNIRYVPRTVGKKIKPIDMVKLLKVAFL